PPPSPPPSCIVCAYVTLQPSAAVTFPYQIPSEQCQAYADIIVSNVTSTSASVGAVLLQVSPVTCGDDFIKVCFVFSSGADASKLQPYMEVLVPSWILGGSGGAACPPYLNGYTVTAAVAGNGHPASPPSSGCLDYITAAACAAPPSPVPARVCNTTQRLTPFAATPFLETYPGRKTTTLYCFNISLVTPVDPDSFCGSTTTLRSVEIWADVDQRARIKGFGLQTAGSTGFTFVPQIWGPVDEATNIIAVKTSAFYWALSDANGGKVCLELDGPATPQTICKFNGGACWIALFDESKDCCPIYQAALP
ncbi:hypothetical protein Vretifemale_19550, partial [Volvox reticuliferus]